MHAALYAMRHAPCSLRYALCASHHPLRHFLFLVPEEFELPEQQPKKEQKELVDREDDYNINNCFDQNMGVSYPKRLENGNPDINNRHTSQWKYDQYQDNINCSANTPLFFKFNESIFHKKTLPQRHEDTKLHKVFISGIKIFFVVLWVFVS